MYQVLLYRSKTGTCTMFCRGSIDTCNTVLYSSIMKDWFLSLGYTHWALESTLPQRP